MKNIPSFVNLAEIKGKKHTKYRNGHHRNYSYKNKIVSNMIMK